MKNISVNTQLNVKKNITIIDGQKKEKQILLQQPIRINNVRDVWDYIYICASILTAIIATIPVFLTFLSKIRKYWIKIIKAQICYRHINDEGYPDELGLDLELENTRDFSINIESVWIFFFTRKKEILFSLKFKNYEGISLLACEKKMVLFEPEFPEKSTYTIDNAFCLLKNKPDLFDKLLKDKKVKYSKIELKTNLYTFIRKLSSKDTKVSIQNLLHYNKSPFSD